MGKLRKTALILGEGPTEFYYFKSLCDVYKNITIKPDYPKHTSIKELELKIEEGIALGYSHIFCVIDMDTKDTEPERTQYQKLSMPNPSKNSRKAYTATLSSLRLTAAPSCSSSTTSAIPPMHTRIKSRCLKT